jgi:hypothetical protein
MVQDSPTRVVPSLLFFPTTKHISDLTSFITDKVTKSQMFINDMEILGAYDNKLRLPFHPIHNICLEKQGIIFDGAAIGQYLGGVDSRNNQTKSSTIGFINETSTFKPNTCEFARMQVTQQNYTTPQDIYACIHSNARIITPIANLHIHSKELYHFSSIFNVRYSDIITGDRILGLCDFVICTRVIRQYHKNMDTFAKDVIIVNDFKNINVARIIEYFEQCVKTKGTRTLKLCLYTHILRDFMEHVMSILPKDIDYTLYIHNSDHSFDKTFKPLVDNNSISRIYAQNIDYHEDSSKLALLPIGIANSMWAHGDLQVLYNTMVTSYKTKKPKCLYVNINPSTFQFRQELVDEISKTQCWDVSENKPYPEYLKELSLHRFCLCVRGNGIDTHRFWESLYLGVIPVIIDNKSTNCQQFLRYLDNMDVPYLCMQAENASEICTKFPLSYFTEDKYKAVISKNGYPFKANYLKLSTYT